MTIIANGVKHSGATYGISCVVGGHVTRCVRACGPCKHCYTLTRGHIKVLCEVSCLVPEASGFCK